WVRRYTNSRHHERAASNCRRSRCEGGGRHSGARALAREPAIGLLRRATEGWPPRLPAVFRERSTWRRPLGGEIDSGEGLARRHEQAVALGATKANIAADLGQPDAADQLAGRRPHRHAAIAHGAAGVARDPEIAVDVAARSVGPALDAVD